MYKKSKILLALITLLGVTNLIKAQNFKTVKKYPKSSLIEKLEWVSTPYKYPGTASDMHWWTWGIDDAIYTLDDDGDNFGGRYWYAHILKVTGTPPKHKVETLTDFEGYDFRDKLPKKLLLRYVCGLICSNCFVYI